MRAYDGHVRGHVQTRYSRISKHLLLVLLASLVPVCSMNVIPEIHASPYSLSAIPGSTAEGNTVKVHLSYAGTPANNDTVPIVYDATLNMWLGAYTIRPEDTGGLWSLVVSASDSSTTPNTGLISRAFNVQNTGGSAASTIPLYYYGITAGLIAALLGAVFFMFKRRKVTLTQIDLDAVSSEAGKIENTEFFKSVREQVKKEKTE